MANFFTKARLLRLAIGCLIPPVLIAIAYAGINLVASGPIVSLAAAWLTLYFAIRIAGIQLVLYSLAMEFLIVPKLKNIYGVALVSSLMMTLIVATAFITFFGRTFAPFERDILTPILGFILGGLLGYGLKRHYQNTRDSITAK
ncbi:MAG: hypothetical protein KTR27_03010 [Leptolyngbyaceae cyanobacterium MAG.088]|nr:hypothetical protein [Leptolyngbyaceae cyanobacterium MAG.088]